MTAPLESPPEFSKNVKLKKSSQIKKIIFEHFLSGLFILAPILIVAIVFQWVFGGILGWIEAVPLKLFLGDESSDVAGAVKVLIGFGVIAVGIFGVSLLGFFSKVYFGKQVLVWIGEAIQKIPFFGGIYSSIDQLVKALSHSGGKQFSRVVYVEYPRKEVWAVGFVTGPATLKGIPEGYLNVFVPTVPNPTSGFHLLIKESEVKDSGLKVEEAFQLILSLGISQPGAHS